MLYIDTNVLIYSIVRQDVRKQEQSLGIIEDAVDKKQLALSPLVLSEFVFSCSKLSICEELTSHEFAFYSNFVEHPINMTLVIQAYQLSKLINYSKNINDVIHLKFAEKYCTKLITFDSDFKKFITHTSLEIEILDGNRESD